jgi:hypothetical protein
MENDIINRWQQLLAKDTTDADDSSSSTDDTDDTDSDSTTDATDADDSSSSTDDTTDDTDSDTDSDPDDDSDDEVLYKMVDGVTVPCTPEETAAILAQWAQAAIEAQQQQQISDLKAQDLSTMDKIQCLMTAVNALAQGQTIPADLAAQINNSCEINSLISSFDSD